uniref:Uncharacterized protein n=1 Tax=Anguilla anguilla TaxID=7936 RepID=A0A0E9XW27_ANGAN
MDFLLVLIPFSHNLYIHLNQRQK